MSLLSTMANIGLSTIAQAAGSSLMYRIGTGGTWTALPGATLVPMDPLPVLEDQTHRVITAPQMASFRAPLGSPLFKAGPGGDFVRDANLVEWAIISVSYRVSHTQYTCERQSIVDAGQVAGRV